MIEIILGGVVSIIHYFSENVFFKFKRHFEKISSFSAGIALTYIILHLFPFFSEGANEINEFLFLSVLIGFLFFHLIEKVIYRKAAKDSLQKDLAAEDSAVSFLYHFLVGILMVSFFEKGFQDGILFFIPILFYTGTSVMTVDITPNQFIKAGLALSTFIGAIFGKYFYVLSQEGLYAFLGFIIGALLFTVTRHSIPGGNKGEPFFFTMGIVFYSIILYVVLL
ncbi:MAG: hypothetical protein ACMXYK_03690 [Candidatus Woesearchaeota archaeon]